MLVLVPIIIPFIVSFANSKQIIPTSSGYTRVYAAVLLLGTGAGIWRIVSAESVGAVLLTAVALAIGFAFAANTMNSYVQRDA